MTIPTQLFIEDAVQRAMGVSVCIDYGYGTYEGCVELTYPEPRGLKYRVPLSRAERLLAPQEIVAIVVRRIEVVLAKHLAQALE